jgi:hypothetical protein
MNHLDTIFDDLSVGMARRTRRRRRMRAVRTATAGAAAALVIATSTAGLVSEPSTTATADAGAVLGFSNCERDAFGCLKLPKAPQD